MSDKKKTVILVVLIVFFAILRLFLVSNVPIVANVELSQDDTLMVFLADSIRNGDWLGKYGTSTFLKGPMFPIFLALINILHLKYIPTITLIYILSCIALVWVLRKPIKNKGVLFGLYLLMLFNPIMLSYDLLQRVYRNSLIPSLSILIIAGYINLFVNRNEKISKKVLTIIGLSIVLPIFWLTREDSIWILPFIIFMSLSIIIGIFIKNRKELKKAFKEVFKNILLLVIPLISIIVLMSIISVINEKYYGVRTVYNKYAKELAVDSLKSVKNNEEVDKVSNTREKIFRVAGVCPNLQEILPVLNKRLDAYAVIDGNPDDLEVEDGWFEFALSEAVRICKYAENPQKLNDFYYGMYTQIESAIANGALERTDSKIFDFDMIQDIMNRSFEAFKFIFNLENVSVDFSKGENVIEQNVPIYELYKDLTGNEAFAKQDLYDEDGNLVFSLEEKDNLVKNIKCENEIVNNIIKIYKPLNKIIISLGLVSYCLIVIFMIIDLFKKKYDLVESWVISSGILGAVFTLILGIALITVTTFYAISVIYLCATYALVILFSIVSIYAIVNNIILRVKKENIKE